MRAAAPGTPVVGCRRLRGSCSGARRCRRGCRRRRGSGGGGGGFAERRTGRVLADVDRHRREFLRLVSDRGNRVLDEVVLRRRADRVGLLLDGELRLEQRICLLDGVTLYGGDGKRGWGLPLGDYEGDRRPR